ncbi:hypothetical protein DFJ58DRAFT_669619, partial [Suillus subalutaceus]|uniref:uncharacterized protein n=1 Tax=Suillus subalutaceus TaxID=48586 RepID=UPI001B8867C3
HIDAARSGITQICNTLLSGGNFTPGDLRFGLIAFRDPPPQNPSFIVQEYPFTTDVGSVAENLGGLTATGGGNGPESQSDALSAAYKADWKDEATNIMVLITDSPPHGIGEDGDAFPKGRPLRTSRFWSSVVMNQRWYYVIACEPTLSQYYKRACDFYQGLVKKTGGKAVNLGDLSALPTLIAGSALEAVRNEIYVVKHQAKVRSMANDQKMSASEISQRLHKSFVAAGIQHSTLVVDNMHEQRTHGDQNADIWLNAENFDEAKNNIQEVKYR